MNLEKLKPYEQKDGIRKSSLSPFLSTFLPPSVVNWGLNGIRIFT